MNSWAEKIRIAWRDLVLGVQNLIVWFPVIWKDRYWDYIYLLILMQKKLELMERGILENKIHVNYQRDAFQIKRCRLVMKRLIEGQVYYNEAKLFPNNYGKSKYHLSEERKSFDVEYLFSQMRKHLRGWWD